MNDTVAGRDATFAINGLRLHYREWGKPNTPALVLLHGYTSHARSWDTVAARMADRYRVLALDFRGFGESDWASDYHELRLLGDLAQFVDAMGLTTFSLVGMSIGGSNAGSYALLYPDRVSRLIMVECFTEGDEQGDAAWIQVARRHLSHLRALPEFMSSLEEAVTAYRPLAPRAPQAELKHWVSSGLIQREDGRWQWRFDPRFRQPPSAPGRLNAPVEVMRRRLAGVSCPTMLLVGAESWMVEPVRHMAFLNPRVCIEQVPAAGHWAQLDNPDGFLAMVDRFLNEG